MYYEKTSFWESLAIHKRVIGALLMREILDRFGRHNIGFLWIFFEPMLFTLAVTTLWSTIRANHGTTVPVVAFAVTGYSSVLLWRNMPNRCCLAVQPNHTLMHHRNIKLIDIYMSRVVLEITGATCSFMVLSLFFTSIGWMSLPQYPLQVFFGWMMLAWFGVSLALFIGAVSERAEIAHILWHPTAYILFPLSGACFSVDVLPTEYQNFVLFLPMVHGVEIVRGGWFGSAYTAHFNVAYFASCNLILMLIGLTQVRAVSRKVVA
jgi:ABC-type polysaccharide/polyol phosphate export permease